MSSRKPYADYVGEFFNKNNQSTNRGVTTNQNNKQTKQIDIRDTPKLASDEVAAERGDKKALARIQKLAASQTGGSPNRKFLVSSAKTFLGSMK